MKKILAILFSLCWCYTYAENISAGKVFISKDSISGYPNYFNDQWKFKEGDDSAWAQSGFNDSTWEETNSDFYVNENFGKKFKGIGWFRLHVIADSTIVGVPLAMMIKQLGASEIYLDGKRIKTFGKINGADSSVYFNPQELPFVFIIPTDGEHVFAVRYANYNAEKNFRKYMQPFAGFRVMLGFSDHQITRKDERSTIITFVLMLLCGIFFALCLIHLFLFFYYRADYSNLFFSVFMFCIAALFLVGFIAYAGSSSEFVLKCTSLISPLLLVASVSLSGFINTLFNKKKLAFKINVVVAAATLIIRLAGVQLYASLTMGLIIAVSIQAIFSIVIAMVRRVKGVRIIGSGILFSVMIFLFLFVLAISEGGDFDLNDSTVLGQILILLLALSILSIPISMSIYQAWRFAGINKDLAEQLVQVKTLSEKTIEQEQEKQLILENQKTELETKVKERTAEVVHQKEIVEEQNKEIRDSIQYALRIQTAILPPGKIVKQYLENSFVLYKPKDIVAGDFYWMTTTENNAVLVAACDCTGHGVPGALVSVVCHNALNRAVREFALSQPSLILDKTSELLQENFSSSDEDIKDGMDVSLLLLKNRIAENEIEIEWAGANNSLWILLNDANEIEEIKADKQPIGKTENFKPFNNHQIKLQKGDSVYLFTDGFADQFGGTDTKKLTRKKFKELILSIRNIEMSEQGKALEKFIDDYKKNTTQTDDILVMGIKI